MNKYIYKFAICLSSVLILASCAKEQKDLFDESSANRLTQAANSYTELLSSSEDGWVMEYFANEDEQGYTFLMKFDKNGSVTIAGKNKWTNSGAYTTATSLWEMITDASAVLTFNTYNDVFHVFSDPDDIAETTGDDEDETGRGHYGDYEFIMESNDGDNITLKGKKHELIAYMHRLPAGTNWEEYFTNLDKVKNSLFSSKISTLWFTAANGEKYSITNSTTGVFSFVPDGGDAIAQTITSAFIVLPNGLRMLTPFTGENDTFSVQNFEIAEDGSLVCKEDGVSNILAPQPSELILDKYVKWQFDAEQLGGKFVQAYAAVVNDCKTQYKEEFKSFNIGYDAVTGNRVISFSSGKYTGKFYTDITSSSLNNITLTYKGTGDKNATAYLKKCPSFDEFMTLISASEYQILGSSPICPTQIKFVSKADNNDYFVVNIQ